MSVDAIAGLGTLFLFMMFGVEGYLIYWRRQKEYKRRDR
jgi:hypothetical protein